MEKLDVVNAALAALRAGKTCELVVVAGTAGSSPRGVGAWMAVFADVGVAIICVINAMRAMGDVQ